MSNTTEIFVSKIEKDGDDLVLLSQPAMLKEMNFQEGDFVYFIKDTENNQYIMRKMSDKEFQEKVKKVNT